MSKIALVNVALIVNGERRNFKPGEQLPELPEHDEEALIASKSIKDKTAESNAARASASEQRKGDAEFQAARLRVQAEADSRNAVDVSDAGAGNGAGGSANAGDIGTLSTAIHGDGTGTALPPVVQAEADSHKAVDAPDADSNTGGESTAVVGADGANNRIFNDISELDSAHGNVRVQPAAAPASSPARKTVPAAKTSNRRK